MGDSSARYCLIRVLKKTTVSDNKTANLYFTRGLTI